MTGSRDVCGLLVFFVHVFSSKPMISTIELHPPELLKNLNERPIARHPKTPKKEGMSGPLKNA